MKVQKFHSRFSRNSIYGDRPAQFSTAHIHIQRPGCPYTHIHVHSPAYPYTRNCISICPAGGLPLHGIYTL